MAFPKPQLLFINIKIKIFNNNYKLAKKVKTILSYS